MKIGLQRQNTLMTWPSAIGREIDLDRRAGGDRGGIRVHLATSGPGDRRGADRADGARCDVKKIAACRLGRRHRAHGNSPFPLGRSVRPRGRPRSAVAPTVAPTAANGSAAASPGEGSQAAQSGGVLLAPLLARGKPASAAATAKSRCNHTARPAYWRSTNAAFADAARHRAPDAHRPLPARHRRKIPERFCGSRACLGLSRAYHRAGRLSGHPTAPSAAPAWTISTR